VVAVASPDDVEAANKEKAIFSDIKKCLWFLSMPALATDQDQRFFDVCFTDEERVTM
jgi:hypothetical protein